jgi:hypothetical protein
MSRKANGKKHSMSVNSKRRRVSQLIRLRIQLLSELKPDRDENGKTISTMIPLTDKDIKRIQNEIKTIEERV